MNELHFGEIIRDGRLGIPEAGPPMSDLANDPEQAGIVRATALSALGGYSGSFASQAVRIGLQDNDPLARWSALRMLETSDPGTTLRLAFPLLTDSIRAVRIEAARLLASVPAQNLTATQGFLLDEVVEEYIASEITNADRPEAHLNIGVLHMRRGAFTDAETSFQTALRILPTSVPAKINLADLYRLIGRENDGEAMLREAIDLEPEVAEAHHALGLLLVRQQRIPDALESLKRAAVLLPENARMAYVYGIALHSTGDIERALSVLEEAALHHPSNRDILLALVTINRDSGNSADALRHAKNLRAVFPEDRLATQLLEQLENL